MSDNQSNMYDITEQWLTEVAPKYFDLPDLSLNRIGLFGYVNELMAHSLEAMSNENSILYNELFFKRAVLPQSIYAYASHYNLEDINAKPASMQFALGITEKDLLEKSVSDESGDYFIIDSDSTIMVEEKIPFMLDYSIKITIKQDYDGRYIYSAKYITEGLDNPISDINSTSNPFVKLIEVKQDLTNYIFVYVTAHQCEKITSEKILYSQDFIDYFTFDIGYDQDKGQLADFSAYYKAPTESEYTQIKKMLIDLEAVDGRFCYYQYKDYNTINISFATAARYFKPEFNSSLQFIFYNTLGAEGNFKYTGDNVSVILKSDNYDYKNLIMIGKSLSNSEGGRDRKTYEEIKNMVAAKASTCNILSTDIDLNAHFENLSECSKIYFCKKRDDIIDRRFGAFLLLKDSENYIMPTNTVNLQISENQFDSFDEVTKRYIIKPGKRIVYIENSKTAKVISDDDVNEYSYEYRNPFTLVVNRHPFFIEYYMPSINYNYIPDYYKISDYTIFNLICTNINIERDAYRSKTYTITIEVNPNIDDLTGIPDIATTTDNWKTFTDTKFVKMLGYIYDTNGKIVNQLDDFKMISYKNSTHKMVFQTSFTTDDYVSAYSYMRITDGIIEIDDKDNETPLIDATRLKFGFLGLIKGNKFLTSDSDIRNRVTGTEGYDISNIFMIDEYVDILNNLNKLMYSSVEYCNSSYHDDLTYLIKEVPVVRKDFMDIKDYSDEFIYQFTKDYGYLKKDLDKLTNAYNICIKLFNTYGKSSYFYINQDKDLNLDRVNMAIHFRIKLNPNKINDTPLKISIKDFIKNYIDEVNDDINLYISNLIKSLENNFEDIRFINFKNINEYSSEVQSVEKNFPSIEANNLDQLLEFVPEYLNINKTYEGYHSVKFDVDVEFI